MKTKYFLNLKSHFFINQKEETKTSQINWWLIVWCHKEQEMKGIFIQGKIALQQAPVVDHAPPILQAFKINQKRKYIKVDVRIL